MDDAVTAKDEGKNEAYMYMNININKTYYIKYHIIYNKTYKTAQKKVE